MIVCYIYIVVLLMAPQLWLPPFVGIPIDYLIIPAWFLSFLISSKSLRSKSNVQDVFFLLFLIWIPISSIVNGTLFIEYREMGIPFVYYFTMGISYYLVKCSTQSMQDLKRAATLFAVIAIALAVEGIQHKLTGIGWAGQTLGWIDPAVLEAGGTGRTRWVGIFDGPGVFAVIYTIGLPFLLGGTSRLFPLYVRVISMVSLPLMFVAIYFNGSRGGLLAGLSVLVMHFGLRKKISRRGMVIGLVIALALFSLSPRYMTDVNDSQRSSYHRIEMWTEGLEMVVQHPVFGIGMGNFQSYTSSLIAHSSPIQVMGETGFVGLFFWVGMIYVALRNIQQQRLTTTSPNEAMVAKCLMIAIVGYLVSSFFVTLEYPTFYLLLAWASAIGSKNAPPWQFTKKDLQIILVLCIGWIGLVFGITKWYQNAFF